MKKIMILLPLMFSVFLLAGCGPVYQTQYSYVPPHSWRGRKCINRCLTARSYCRGECQTNDQACHSNANVAAMPAYLAYVQERNSKGKPTYMNVSDFADYSNCSDHCGCESTYRACFSNCGGEVIANTQCVAFCNQR